MSDKEDVVSKLKRHSRRGQSTPPESPYWSLSSSTIMEVVFSMECYLDTNTYMSLINGVSLTITEHRPPPLHFVNLGNKPNFSPLLHMLYFLHQKDMLFFDPSNLSCASPWHMRLSFNENVQGFVLYSLSVSPWYAYTVSLWSFKVPTSDEMRQATANQRPTYGLYHLRLDQFSRHSTSTSTPPQYWNQIDLLTFLLPPPPDLCLFLRFEFHTLWLRSHLTFSRN